METVSFSDGDAWFYWAIPSGGCDLARILDTYVFVARVGVPSYDTIRDSLSRAIRAGLVVYPRPGQYQLSTLWDVRFQEIIQSEFPTELGIMKLDEFLSEQEWPQVGPEVILDEREYKNAAAEVERHYKQLFRQE